MATDWAADVRKCAPNADDKAIAGIVRYCGIALQKRDSSLVSFGDKEEVARVRSNFLKKKLGLTQLDAELRRRRMKVHLGKVFGVFLLVLTSGCSGLGLYATATGSAGKFHSLF